MEPTIKEGSSVVGRLSDGYRGRLRRFDIVIYRVQGAIYAKRVIGLPGERITIEGNRAVADGVFLNLPDNVDQAGLQIKECDVQLPSDAIFVIGDNSRSSYDSRYFGPLPLNDVIGEILFEE